MKSRYVLATSLGILIAGSSPWWLQDNTRNTGAIQSGVPREDETAQESMTPTGRVVPDTGHSYMSGSGRLLEIVTDVDLDVSAVWSFLGKVLLFNYEERTLSGEWVKTSDAYSTSFGITDAAASGSHTLFVAGVTPRGNDIVEAWRFDIQPGSFHASSLASPVTIFEPPYRAPSDRPGRRPPEREVVFHGDLPGAPVHLVAAPDHARVYGLFGEVNPTGTVPNRIYTFDVETGDATESFSSEEDAFLQFPFTGMAVMQDPTTLEHAIWMQPHDPSGNAFMIILRDADRDGALEGGNVYTHSVFQAAGFDSWVGLSG